MLLLLSKHSWLLLFALVFASFFDTVDATAFAVKDGSSCWGAFTLSSEYPLDVECDGDECALGKSFTMTGELESDISQGIGQTGNLTIVVSLFGISLVKLYEQEIDLCSYLEPHDETTCPENGTYTYEFSGQLPGDGSISLWHGYSFSLKGTFVPTDGSGAPNTTCTIPIQAVQNDSSSSSSSSSTASMVTWSLLGLAVLCAAGVFVEKRRRQTGQPAALLDLSEGPTANFERMADHFRQGTMA
jgi:hypothetical protein